MAFYSGSKNLNDFYITNSYIVDRFVNGILYMCGNNSNGYLGDNTLIKRSSPVQTIARGFNWSQVSVGAIHTAGIKTDGSLWLWGNNAYGQLGDNTITSKSSPVQTIAGGQDWKLVVCGVKHTAAIKTNGTIWFWGNNSYGQLGDNTNISKSSPIQTIGGYWKTVSCGTNLENSAAIRSDGTLWLWGRNDYGQLGTNSIITRSSPVQTISAGGNWASISLDGNYSAATKTDGTLWAWGINNLGSLGDNTTVRRSSPIQTVAQGTNWKYVSAVGTTYGIKTDGTLWAWGNNQFGTLGDNTVINRSSPVQTIASGSNWKYISGSDISAFAIKTDGTLWTWGSNSNGQLGDNTVVNKSSPIQTTMLGYNWISTSGNSGKMGAIITNS